MITSYLVPFSGDLLTQLFIHTQGTFSLWSPFAMMAPLFAMLHSSTRLGRTVVSCLKPRPALQFMLRILL